MLQCTPLLLHLSHNDVKPLTSRVFFQGRVCVADIEVDQRLAFYIELVSVGQAAAPGF